MHTKTIHPSVHAVPMSGWVTMFTGSASCRRFRHMLSTVDESAGVDDDGDSAKTERNKTTHALKNMLQC